MLGKGKYCFHQEYKYLEVFSMTRKQRSKVLKKVSKTQVIDTCMRDPTEECGHTSTSSGLSTDILCLTPYLGLTVACLQAISNKANELLERKCHQYCSRTKS